MASLSRRSSRQSTSACQHRESPSRDSSEVPPGPGSRRRQTEAFETEAEVVEEPKKEEKKEEPEEAQHDVPDPGESGVDDIMSKLGELDDPENKPKKKEKKSDDDEDASGMDDILGKLDEL